MKIAVGYPWSSPFMFTGFSDGNMNMRCPIGCEMRWFRGSGWSPARRHNHICEQAIEWEADYIVIVGADQQHPEDMIERLLARVHDGCEVISAMVPTRGNLGHANHQTYAPMAWRLKKSGTYLGCELSGDMMDAIDPDAGDLQEIDFIGSGVLMFSVDHLAMLKKPWFEDRIIDREKWERIANMDTWFVWRLKAEAHAKVWLDTTIKVRHLNVEAIDETWQEKFNEKSRHKGNGVADRNDGNADAGVRPARPAEGACDAGDACCKSSGSILAISE